MKVQKFILISIFLIVLSEEAIIAQDFLGGFNEIAKDRLKDFQTNDPAYILAYPKVSKQFEAQYGVSLGQIQSAFYQIVGGVKYKVVYSSPIGTVQAQFYIIYWMSVIKDISFTVLPTKQTISYLNETEDYNSTDFEENQDNFTNSTDGANQTENSTLDNGTMTNQQDKVIKALETTVLETASADIPLPENTKSTEKIKQTKITENSTESPLKRRRFLQGYQGNGNSEPRS